MFRLILLAALAPSFATANPLDLDPELDIDASRGEVERPAAPIVNGEEETKWPQAIALGSTQFGFSACSGSIIAPRVVLTAAHCGADFPLELMLDFGEVIVGTSMGDVDHTLKAVDFKVHPDYRPLSGMDTGAYDIALFELAEDAPVEPIWINTDPLKAKDVGKEVLSVGWGITGASGAGGGTKRSAPLIVDEIDEMFVLSVVSTNENNANICSGDSGGPQYHFDEETGEWIQWAVHSWGDSNCLFNSGSTRTDVAKKFILDFVEDVHGTSDFCAIQGRYGDGVCDTNCDETDIDCLLGDPALFESLAGESEKGGCNQGGGPTWLWLGFAPLVFLRRGR